MSTQTKTRTTWKSDAAHSGVTAQADGADRQDYKVVGGLTQPSMQPARPGTSC